MQQLIDFAAVIAFVAIYFITKDIFLATGVLLALVCVQVAALKLMKRTISRELQIIFWPPLILGGLTLLLRDETFIQWKPTIVSWAITLVLVGAHMIARTHLLKKMLGHALTLPDAVWTRLTYGWAVGFLLSGGINIWVVETFSLDAWVTFKLLGLTGLNFLYILIMVAYLVKIGALAEKDAAADPSSQQDEAQTKTNPSEQHAP